MDDRSTGHRFTPAQKTAVLVVGTIGVMIVGLEPQLLAALALDGRLPASVLGNLATIELLAMGIAAGAAGFILPINRLRGIAAAAVLATAALDWLTPGNAAGSLYLLRGLAGVTEGVLVWIVIGLIVRTSSPARWSGIYLLVQTLAQLGVAVLLSMVVLPGYGSRGGFACLAAVTLLALSALPWLPRVYAPLDATPASAAMPPVRGIAALAGVALYLAFIVSVWVYIEPLALMRGFDAGTVAWIAPLALALQVIGAGAATLLAGKIPALRVVLAIGALNLGLLAAMGNAGSSPVFLAAAGAFGFLWLFLLPFHIPVVIAADPSRQSAALIGGAQLIGASIGPFAAARIVGDADVTGILWLGGALILASLALLAASVAAIGR